MRSVFLRFVIVASVAVALVACDRNEGPRLMNIASSGQGPDEFSIIPNKPLRAPESYTELPPPTPLGRNRADASPLADAVVALGGDPAATRQGGVPSADLQLVRHTDRYGRNDRIRAELAAADLRFRRENQGRVLERVLDVNVYFEAYEHMSLDKYAELERFRAIGIRTPAAPPDPVEAE